MKVSVVVIAKNAEKTLARCLSSVLSGSRTPDEIIVVDGRSQDRTREVARRFPVKLIVAPPKDTYGTSRNLGVREAEGKIIAFLDSDDYAERDWLERLVEAMSSEDVGMVGARREYVYPRNWFTRFKWDLLGGRGLHRPPKTFPNGDGGVIPIRGPGKHLGTSGSAYRKEAIIRAGCFDENLFFGCEDIDLALRMMKAGYRLVFAPSAVIYFQPATSIREWFRESFYRTGIGYGVLRRRYGHYRPPYITPTVSMATFLGMVGGWLWSLPALTTLSALLFASFLLAKTMRYAKKTGRWLMSLAYSLAEVVARNLSFTGFMIGYLLPPRLLRRLARR